MDYAVPDEAYLAGLLHDVGRLALLSCAPHEYQHFFLTTDADTLCVGEQDKLHISHTEAGAWLIKHWHLDSFLADSVLYHHEPAARLQGSHTLIRIVKLAQVLATQEQHELVQEDWLLLCELPLDLLTTLTDAAGAQVTQAAEQLGVDISESDNPQAPTLASQFQPSSTAQARLTDEMRQRSLMTEFSHALTRQKTDAQLLDAIRQNAKLIFNLENTLILLISANSRALIGVSAGGHQQHLDEFVLPLATGGAIADAALQRRLVFIGPEEGQRHRAEEQLLRVFNAHCLVGIPLVSQNRCLGVLVAGVPDWRVAELKSQEKWLRNFGSHAAAALVTSRDRGEADRRVGNIREEYRLTANKLVHETSNPLAIIKNYLSVVDDKLNRQEPLGQEMAIVNEEIDRVGQLLQSFAGTAPKPQETLTDINPLLSSVITLLTDSKLIPPSVEVTLEMPGSALLVDGAADPIRQILINLLKNAAEAMPAGGQITVRSKGLVQHEGLSLQVLHIIDNGPGMSAQVQEKLFSPQLSTKPGPNRGLGLSVVHELVTQLGGAISCQSGNTGTRFELLLPASPSSGRTVLASTIHPA
jgi:signal transduction histidine kinase